MKKIFITGFLVFIFLMIYATGAHASWYSDYEGGDFYGLWATIWTPSSAPYTPEYAGQSNSVTTTMPYWMQTGWRYYAGDTLPDKYWEYCAINCENDDSQFDRQPAGKQSWNTGIKYEVSFDGSLGPKTWCAWIGGIKIKCKDNVKSPPSYMIAQSEVHFDSRVQVNTLFQSVYTKNASGYWVGANLDNHLFADFPYAIVKLSSVNFRTYRLQTHDVFLPLVIK